MKAKWLPLSAAVALAFASVSASAVDFNGYMRSGMIYDQYAGAGDTLDKKKVGRLGNETDTYLEIALGQEVYNKAGVTMKLNTMMAYSGTGANDWENLSGGFRQANVEVNNVFGLGETIWIGKRYNNRNDIHITDFYYWDVSGESVGVSGIDFGKAGKLGFSVTRSDRSENNTSRNYIVDLRLVGTDLGFGSLDLGVDYALSAQTEQEELANDSHDGAMITGQFTIPFTGETVSGFNKTIVQFGNAGWSNVLAYYGGGNWYGAETHANAKAVRAINWGVTSIGKFSLGHSILWSYSSDLQNDKSKDFESISNFDIVARPMYSWNDYHKTILELGYGYTSSDPTVGEKTSSIEQKYTIAQAITAGAGFWARPELRFFVSYLDSNNDGKFNKRDTTKTTDHQFQFGVQAEAWW